MAQLLLNYSTNIKLNSGFGLTINHFSKGSVL